MARFNTSGTAKALPNWGRYTFDYDDEDEEIQLTNIEEREGTWNIAYGFDRFDGYFIQGYFDCPIGGVDLYPDYRVQGDKNVIIESPFYKIIEYWRDDHAFQIMLDIEIPNDTMEMKNQLLKKYLAFEENDERRKWAFETIKNNPADKLANPDWKDLIE